MPVILKIEVPFSGVNTNLLQQDVADTFGSLTTEDIDISVYDTYIVGIRVDVPIADVDQAAVDAAIATINATLGATVNVVGWGEPPLETEQ